MQIRAAVGANGQPAILLASKYLVPLLETCVRVLPHAYRAVAASEGTTLTLRLATAPPRAWTLRREGAGWHLYDGEPPQPTALVKSEPDALWRLFFNALPVGEASQAFAVDGPQALVAPFLRARSVMV